VEAYARRRIREIGRSARGGIDGADLFERFRVWASRANDVGVQTGSVLRSGQPWDQAAAAFVAANPGRGAGNGGPMRSTPTAVHFATASLDETIAAAHATSAITHAGPAADWGAAIHHVMVRAALHGDDPFAALARAARAAARRPGPLPPDAGARLDTPLDGGPQRFGVGLPRPGGVGRAHHPHVRGRRRRRDRPRR
jgi:hypothetical protein